MGTEERRIDLSAFRATGPPSERYSREIICGRRTGRGSGTPAATGGPSDGPTPAGRRRPGLTRHGSSMGKPESRVESTASGTAGWRGVRVG
jgi:hypothetical protein